MNEFTRRGNLIGIFARHRVAANLLMMIMILSGVWGLLKMNTQFFPNFTLETITVRVAWRGASAEDIEDGLSNRLEEALRTQQGLRKITSTSAEGVATVVLEYETGVDMSRALDLVKEKVALIRDLPESIEEPEVTRATVYDRVARILLWSENDPRALRDLAYRFEAELLDRGISRVDLIGMEKQEIAIELSIQDLQTLSLSLDRLGERIASLSKESPAGSLNQQQLSQQLRSARQLKTVDDYARIPIHTAGGTVQLGDIAEISRRARQKQVSLSYQGKPAIELRLMREENSNSLAAADILEQWLQDTRPTLPAGVNIKIYDERWQYILQRINLLLKNGLTGLVLVILILFFFLRGPVALWVAIGIPVSFMATLAVLYLAGGSINMISLFGLIMALGIIVDDAIVVGEDAMTHYELGEQPLSAAEGGASRMLAPVIASSLTTIAAFIPLLLISGFIGKLLFTIPLVIICVIIASLIESFLVLPGHLRYSFERMRASAARPSGWRQHIDDWFDRLRDKHFRNWVERAINSPVKSLALVFALVILTLALLLSGRIPFSFLPSPESSIISANIQFTAGTPRSTVRQYLVEAEKALDEISKENPGLIVLYSSQLGKTLSLHGSGSRRGDQYAGIRIELVASDQRDIRNPEFIRMLKSRLAQPAALENLLISSRRAGPGGRDLRIQLRGQSAPVLKQAAETLSAAMRKIPGVYGVEDNMPYGQQQLIFQLSPQGKALGLTTQDIGRQLHSAYDGYLVQIFQDGRDEIEVRTILKDEQRNGLSILETLPIILPSGAQATLGSLVNFQHRRGFDVLRHEAGQLALEVSADVDEARGHTNTILRGLLENVLPELASKYHIEYEAVGRATDQAETFADMKIGSLYAMALIYLILAWIFSSYGWPLIVMAIIPFAIVGAVLGHWLTGINLTILSLFGLFGLAGIVVNDSIILVTFYRQLREKGMQYKTAIVEASVRRLRAVLLTSLTTIAGLIPLLFETSLQAQFLIPMATSIAFGLAFSTMLVLFMVPLLLSAYEGYFAKQQK